MTEPRPIYPKHFFGTPSARTKTGFILMPFASEFEPVHQAIRKALGAAGLEPVRADDHFSTRAGLEKILRGIAEAEVVIADMTGRNANVFYEVGIAHTVKENVILLAQSIRDDLPFDLQHIDHLEYSPGATGLEKLVRQLDKILKGLNDEPASPTIRAEPPLPLPARVAANQLAEEVIQVWESEAPGMADNCRQRFGTRLADDRISEAAETYFERFVAPWEKVEALGIAAVLHGDSAGLREILPALGRAYSSSDSWPVNNRLIRGQPQLVVLRTWSLWGALAVHLEQWECVNVLLTSTVELKRRAESEFSSFPKYLYTIHPEGTLGRATDAARLIRQSISSDIVTTYFGDDGPLDRAWACFLFGSAILSVGSQTDSTDPHFPAWVMVDHQEVQTLMRRLEQDSGYASAFVTAVTGQTLGEFNERWGAGLRETLSTYGMKAALNWASERPQLPNAFGG